MVERRRTTGARPRSSPIPREQQRIWEAREAALGVTAFVRGEPSIGPAGRTAPSRPTGSAITCATWSALLAEHGYTAALYGHFGDGVTHCRVNFDFHCERGPRELSRSSCGEAAHLVHRYGGSLVGRAWRRAGARRAAARSCTATSCVQCFREFKAIWDPRQPAESRQGDRARSRSIRTCGSAPPTSRRSSRR